MAIEVTPDDLRALNEKLVVARNITLASGEDDVYVKGLLSEILEVFIPEGYSIVKFAREDGIGDYNPVTWSSD